MASRTSSTIRQSSTKCKAKDHDYLTNLPTEVLLKVVAQAPSKCSLDLIHTSKYLRIFLKLNASRICNEAIRTRYALEAELLETTKEAGWLVPTNREVKYQEGHHITDNRALSNRHRKYFTLLGPDGRKQDV